MSDDAPEPGPEPETPLLRNRDFLAFVLSRSTNIIGIHALTVAVGWHVYQMSGDPVDLGLIGLAQFAPALALFLAAGMAADRFDRRRILIVCNTVHLLVVAMLTGMFYFDVASVGGILAVLVLHGASRSFFHTSSQAILPNLVSGDQFPRAIAYSSSVNRAAQLTGPALGGVLIAFAGNAVYGFILIAFAFATLGSALIGRRLLVHVPEPINLETVMGGFRYVWVNKVVLGAMSIDLVAVLFGGVMGILPVFASDILMVGPDGLGLMRAMPGIGAVVVGLILTQIPSPGRMGPALFVSVALFGLSVVVFSLSTSFVLSLVALAVYGGTDMISVYVRQTLIQIATPDRMRGRVSAINAVSINASNELGDFRAGVMAGGIGTVPAILIGGMITVGVTAVWWRLFPSIRKIDRVDQIGIQNK